MQSNDLRHAYAVLGLSPPVTESRLRRRYKTLVKRWHPDRFQSDPVGREEATQRLRDINIAYHVVVTALKSTSHSQPSPASQEPPTPVWTATPDVPPYTATSFSQGTDPTSHSFHLTPEEIDAIVNSINRQNRIFPEHSHRVLSGVVALIWLALCGAGGGAWAMLKGAFVVALPLLLIWFPDQFDRWTTKSTIAGQRMAPGWFLRVLGWVVFLIVIFSLIMIFRPTL